MFVINFPIWFHKFLGAHVINNGCLGRLWVYIGAKLVICILALLLVSFWDILGGGGGGGGGEWRATENINSQFNWEISTEKIKILKLQLPRFFGGKQECFVVGGFYRLGNPSPQPPPPPTPRKSQGTIMPTGHDYGLSLTYCNQHAYQYNKNNNCE